MIGSMPIEILGFWDYRKLAKIVLYWTCAVCCILSVAVTPDTYQWGLQSS